MCASCLWRISNNTVRIAMRAFKLIDCASCIFSRSKSGKCKAAYRERPCRISQNFKFALAQPGKKNNLNDQGARWQPRRWLACVACAECRWSEEMHWAYIAGPSAEWKKLDEVCALLDPENYIANWPSVPPDEVRTFALKLSWCHLLCLCESRKR